ncbi:MAG: hypothetical protein V3V88_00040 [Dehalococcoidia bacterium]
MDKITCKEAKSQGKVRYFTNKPCPCGHVSERFVSTRACVECAQNRAKRWKADNPDKVNSHRREYYAKNIDLVKSWKNDERKRNREGYNLRNRKYAAGNQEKLKVKNDLWAKNNPDKRAATAAKYRATKLQATPIWADFTKIDRAYELAQEYRGKGIDAEVDHIIPLQGRNVCGFHVQGNLQIINMNHNRFKANNF